MSDSNLDWRKDSANNLLAHLENKNNIKIKLVMKTRSNHKCYGCHNQINIGQSARTETETIMLPNHDFPIYKVKYHHESSCEIARALTQLDKDKLVDNLSKYEIITNEQ